MTRFKKGDKVRFLSKELHEESPDYYPAVGTVGVVVKKHRGRSLWIKWEQNTTSMDDLWWTQEINIEAVSEE